MRGEAGIGKTALVDHVLAEVEASEVHLLRLRPDELAAGVPYGALGNAAAAFARDHRGPRGDAAWGLVAALDDEGGRSAGAVHPATARLLSALRDDGPTVVAVDDLHLLDDDTVVLLASLLRRQDRHPLVLVGALRHPDAELSEALTLLLERLQRDRLVEVVDMAPLDRDGTAVIVRGLLGSVPDDALVEAVHGRSGGNPFFTVQAVLDLVEVGAVAHEGDVWKLVGDTPSLSPGRRGAVLHRVLRLGPTGRRVAEAVALLGSVPLEHLPLVAELADVAEDEARHAFDELAARGILRRDEESDFRFSHQLLRDAIYDDLGPAERWRLHRMAALHLAALPPTPALERAVALHVREAAPFGDDMSIAVLEREAEHACALSPAAAVPWYERALAIMPQEHPRRMHVSYRLARSLFLGGRPRQAVDVGRGLLADLAVLEQDGAAAMRERVVTLVVDALTELSAVHEAADLVESEMATGPVSLRRAAQAAFVLGFAARRENAKAAAGLVEKLLDDAPAGDRVHALVHLAHMCSVSGNFRALAPLWESMRAAAERAPVASQLNAYAAMSFVLAMQGDTEACAQAISQAQDLLATTGLALYRGEIAVAQARNAFNVGEWEVALAVADAVLAELEESGSRNHLSGMRDIKAVLLANQGQWAAAQKAADHTPPDNPGTVATHVLALAELDRTSGNIDGGRARLRSHLATAAVPPGLRAMLLSGLADMHADADDADAVEQVSAELEALRIDELDHSSYVLCCLAQGRARRDSDLVRKGLAVADRHKLALHRGKGRLFLAELGVDPADNLAEAMAVFHALEAAPWRRRAAADLRRLGLKVPRNRGKRPSLLTDTEAQIARLVQLGRPNREIAMTVFLSVKTVEAHLSRIYAKTGCTTRFELARALDSGLLDRSSD